MNRLFLSLLLPLLSALPLAAEKLTGSPIGTANCWNYDTGRPVSDAAANLFDGNLNSYFSTVDESYTWAGLDLGSPHVITRIGWAPRNSSNGPGRATLGVFQGANSPDFLDAVPLYIIRDGGSRGKLTYADVDCSRGFRYVRYVSPSQSHCDMAELEFYGTPGEGNDSHLAQLTNLPVVCINTVDAQEPFDKETDIPGNFIIINGGAIDTDGTGSVRERGNGSRTFPKKPWRLKFDKKKQVLGAPAKAKKWTLINNYGDKSLLRNIVAFDIARRLGLEYVPFCQPVDVILNGEYKGCYQLCDQVEVNPGRVELTEMTAEDVAGDALTGGYLYEIDAYANEEPEGSWFSTSHGTPVTIKSPDAGVAEQFSYIRNYFQKFEDLVYSASFADPVKGYRSILDIDSFIKYFVAGELSGNTDTFWSTYQYKRRGDPMIYTGPVWDVDLGFDNDRRTYPINNIQGYVFNYYMSSEAYGMRSLVGRIIYNDPATAGDITRIWSLARNDAGLTADNLCALVDRVAEELEQSQQLNFKRWPILNEYVHQNPRVYGSYAGEINAVKSYLRNRFPRLDSMMKYDRNMTGTASPSVETPTLHIADGCISLDGATPFTVYSSTGAVLHCGTGTTAALPHGIYIVSTATSHIKVTL